MSDIIETRVCNNSNCGLRYPIQAGHHFGVRCPLCLGTTTLVQTRSLTTESPIVINRQYSVIEALLDNVRSAWNVGSIFRTSDGFGISRIHLCGITPTPENPSVKKTAIGAEDIIPWDYSKNAVLTAALLKENGAHLWALEQDERAVPIDFNYENDGKPLVIIIGNEISGVDPALLDMSERIIYIPMLGKKKSFNVEVAFGVAVGMIRFGYKNSI